MTLESAPRLVTRTAIVRDRVRCALRGTDVAVDECLDCDRVRAVNEDGAPPFVVCDTSDRSDPEGSGHVLLRWWLRRMRRERRLRRGE